MNKRLSALALTIGSIAYASGAHADISNEWNNLNKENQQLTLICKRDWNSAKYAHTSSPLLSDRYGPHIRWILTATTASMISLSGGSKETCSRDAEVKLGVERKRACLDPGNKNPSYECTILLKLENKELIEYTKSDRHGLLREVVGVPISKIDLFKLKHFR